MARLPKAAPSARECAPRWAPPAADDPPGRGRGPPPPPGPGAPHSRGEKRSGPAREGAGAPRVGGGKRTVRERHLTQLAEMWKSA